MMNYDLWDAITKSVTSAIALVAAIAGAVRYFRSRQHELDLRREELAWRKTDLVVRLAEHFDNDPDIQAALKLMEFGDPAPFDKVAETLRNPVEELTMEELKYRYQIDRYCDFFDRLYQFVFVNQTLTEKDTACFTWYIRRIGQVPALTEFAKQNGYEDLLKMYKRYEPQFQTPEQGLLAKV